MPYNPEIQYRGDQYLAQGLAGLGQGIGEGILQAKKDADEAKFNQGQDQVILDFARNSKDQNGNPLLTAEEDANYHTGNDKVKAGIVAGVTRKFTFNMQQQQMQAQDEQRKQNAELAKQRADAFNFTPRIVPVPVPPTVNDQMGFKTTNQPSPIQMMETRKGIFEPTSQPLKPTDKVLTNIPDGKGGFTQAYVTGNEKLKQAQTEVDKANHATLLQTVTTPGAVTYWNSDYTKQISSKDAEDSPSDTYSVLPDGIAMPYKDYKKWASKVVTKAKEMGISSPQPQAITNNEVAARAYLKQNGLPETPANIQHYLKNASQSQ